MLCIGRLIRSYNQLIEYKLKRETVSIDSHPMCVVVLFLLNNWPESFGANTPKEVLYLHEVFTCLILACNSIVVIVC